MALSGRFEADQLYQQALLAAQRERFGDAIAKMTQALQHAPKVAEFLAARGYFYLQTQDTASARADFDAALRLNRYEALANFGIGMLAFRQADWQSAETAFETAWASDPQRPEYLYMLALVALKQRRIDDARQNMELAHAGYARQNKLDDLAKAKAWMLEIERQA